MSALWIKDIYIHKGGKSILQGAEFQINQGEVICVCGPSGGGKSTLLRVMGGLDNPDSGEIRIFERPTDMRHPSALDPARDKMGFVFQNCALISNQTVFDNIALPLRYHPKSHYKDLDARVDQIMRAMLVSDFAHKYPHQISLGIQKRVAVARALITDPDILLLDEPTSGLDYLSRVNLLALISNMSQLRRVAVVLVTHDLLIPIELNAKICILNQKKVSPPVKFDDLSTLQIPFVDELIQEFDFGKAEAQGKELNKDYET
jgi:phospholipid/cholesterol/gamma-HCH transport system ATP-binding protein